jgi:GTP cyclohydrolase II
MAEMTIQRMACARVPTEEGEFQLCLYRNDRDGLDHLALVMGEVAGGERVLVRVHSQCYTGDVLGSRRCDCGEQLHRAMRAIAAAGQGVVLYLPQEGRGIGLLDKLRAYNLQDQGYDTVEANLALGHPPDERDYRMAALILGDLGVRSIDLLTNNPLKIESLKALGVHVARRVPLPARVHAENAHYLTTKVQRMNHLLSLPGAALVPVTVAVRHNGHGREA